MLTIRYEQSLVETTVFLAARGDAELECALHLAVDPIYEIPDEELRQREFAPVYRDLFTKLGLDRWIADLIAERPLIGERVDQCVVREAARQKAESAELLVRPALTGQERPGRTLVVQVCPQSFLDSRQFVPFLRRELLHVSDMLDEDFGYRRETFDGPLSRQNLQRDRYRVLWEIYVEGRLVREGRGEPSARERVMRVFGRVFSGSGADSDVDVFHRLFNATTLTHRQFMDWAREPHRLSVPCGDSIDDPEPSSCAGVRHRAAAPPV